MKDKLIFIVVVLALAGIGTIVFRSMYERVEVEIRTDESAGVRSNKFYGFSRYLESFGIQSAKLIDLNTRTQLPEFFDTLFLDISGAALSGFEQHQLLDWVAAGGQLVLEMPYDLDGSLLGKLGFSHLISDEGDDQVDNLLTDDETVNNDHADLDQNLSDNSDSTKPEADATPPEVLVDETASSKETDEVESRTFVAYLNNIKLGELDNPYVFDQSFVDARPVNWTLTASDAKEASADPKLFAFGFTYGLGFVTTVGQTYQIHNDGFHQLDHSFVMLKALTQNREPGKIWFVSTVTRPGLWDFLWQRAAHLMLWVLLGTVFFFWWAGQRFGRIMPDPTQNRREFHEHIAASGRYLWHHQQRQALLVKTRRSVMQKVHRRFPHLRGADPATRHEYMKQVIGNDIELWDIATREPDELNKLQFLEQISALQKLWKKI